MGDHVSAKLKSHARKKEGEGGATHLGQQRLIVARLPPINPLRSLPRHNLLLLSLPTQAHRVPQLLPTHPLLDLLHAPQDSAVVLDPDRTGEGLRRLGDVSEKNELLGVPDDGPRKGVGSVAGGGLLGRDGRVLNHLEQRCDVDDVKGDSVSGVRVRAG